MAVGCVYARCRLESSHSAIGAVNPPVTNKELRPSYEQPVLEQSLMVVGEGHRRSVGTGAQCGHRRMSGC